tara:strand:- start:9220 stop:9921 length:702 start_codon:yes stop_codon:yes gene_type:complete
MSIPSINISEPKHKIKIEPVAGYVFTQESISHGFIPSPVNTALVSPIEYSNVALEQAPEIATIGGIQLQPDINVQVGIKTDSILTGLLNSFRYRFPDWTHNNIEITEENFTAGQVVFITEENANSNNLYSSTMVLANTTDLDTGAKHNLFIFISYSDEELILLHKGYFDMPDAVMPNWSPGKTIYLNTLTGKLDVTPSNISNNWVRSLGFCIPNAGQKKRVWFEADSTYLKIK